MSEFRIGQAPASGVSCEQCGRPIPANHRPWPVTRHDPKVGRFRSMRVCFECLNRGEPHEKPMYGPSKLRPTPQAFRSSDLRRRGEKVNTAKLNPMKVQQIRMLRSRGLSQVAIARQFGVSQYAIWAILSGFRWRHVPSQGLITA